jgi:hypothetical protein
VYVYALLLVLVTACCACVACQSVLAATASCDGLCYTDGLHVRHVAAAQGVDDLLIYRDAWL